MVKVAADTDKNVMLANDNLTSGNSADSLISTPEDEGYITSAMHGHDISFLSKLIESKKK